MPSQNSIHLIRNALRDICAEGIQGEIALIDHEQPPAPAGHAEYSQCAGYAPQRQAEFIVARSCARSALEALGYNNSNEAIEANQEGLPVWPIGFVASISHSKGLCGAVAATSNQYKLLGFDIEKTNRLSTNAAKRVMHPLETVNGPSKAVASILFSLKEAFYKAQYPEWGIAANFDDLALQLDLKNGSASVLYLAAKFPADLAEAHTKLNFRFVQVENEVLSLCSLRA